MILSHHKILAQIFSRSAYSYYIHLKDHNKKINPQETKLSLSYMRPTKLMSQAPEEAEFVFKLKKKTQQELERKMFEDYKDKVLKGQIDQDEEEEIDPLWGQQKPAHFYQDLSRAQLMTVSWPQNQEFSDSLAALYTSQIQPSTPTENYTAPDLKTLSSLTPTQLVECALNAVQNKQHDMMFWAVLENAIGNKYYEMSNTQLIQLLYCFKQEIHQGSPRANQILRDLLEADAENLTKDEAKFLHFALRHSKKWGLKLQYSVEKAMEKYYSQMSFNEKVDWLFSYTLSSRPQSYKRRHQKILHQKRKRAHSLLYKLNLGLENKSHLTVDSCTKLAFSLAKLKASNTQWITKDIIEYLRENVSELQNDVQKAYRLLFYLPQVQGAEEVHDQELFQKLIGIVTKGDNFAQLTKVQQMKSLFTIWNFNLMTEDIFQLYQNIEMEADSTLLHYFCQIELARSSERQWQVLKCLSELEYIAIPYYQSAKRFYNYMKVTTDWDLRPIEEKLQNTEHYVDCLRGEATFRCCKIYESLKKYEQFSNQASVLLSAVPINNLELCMFSDPQYQVSADIVNESAFVPGTNTLKQAHQNKKRSLENLGWKHIYIRQKELRQLPSHEQLQAIMGISVPFMEEQAQVIAAREYYRAEEIQRMSIQQSWDLMTAEEAEGYRNDAEGYAQKIAELEAKEKALSESVAKNDN